MVNVSSTSDRDDVARRAYRSPKRRAQAARTRAAILAAAHDLFITYGYAGTSLSAVAGAAAVSVPTIEQNFGTKRNLLKAIVDVAKAGDDQPVPVLDRAAAQAAQRARTADEFLTPVVRELGVVSARLAPIVVVLAEAGDVHTDLADLAQELDAQRRAMASWIVAQLARHGLRPEPDTEHAIDTVWVLLDPVVHRRLTHDRGWSVDTYSAWLGDSLRRLLLA